MKWISPSTQSIQITATRSDGFYDYSNAALTPTSNGCTAVTGGTQCVIPFSAPATSGSQTDTVVVYLYDLTSVIQGSPLASGTDVGVTVTAGASNPLSIQLGGILGQPPAWGAPGTTVTPGTPAQVSYPITGAMDIDGNAIGPTDLLDSPLQITLSDTQTYSLVTPAGGLLAYPSAVLLQYNGTYVPGHHTTLTMESTSMDSDNYYFGGPTPVATTLPF